MPLIGLCFEHLVPNWFGGGQGTFGSCRQAGRSVSLRADSLTPLPALPLVLCLCLSPSLLHVHPSCHTGLFSFGTVILMPSSGFLGRQACMWCASVHPSQVPSYTWKKVHFKTNIKNTLLIYEAHGLVSLYQMEGCRREKSPGVLLCNGQF